MKSVTRLVSLLCALLTPSIAHAFDVTTAIQEGTFLLVAFVFAQGLLTALTPCVYPLIPITVSIFGAKAASRGRAALLSALYVLGIAVMFSTLGVAAATTGGLFGKVMSNVWILGFVSLVFVLFAFSLFGAFELTLPMALSDRLSRVGGKGFGGAFVMGLVAGIIAAPCAGPVVGSILAYVGSKGSAPLGFGLLFTYGIGMGVPFFLVGAFAMTLPKSGPWLEGVKNVLGIVLLATALYLLKDAVPALKAPLAATPRFFGMMVLLVALGLGMGAVHKSFHASWRDRLLKGVGVLFVVLGCYGGVAAATRTTVDATWFSDESTALARARAEKKPMLVDFRADWCEACKELERVTYPDPLFKEEASRFVLLQLDVTEDSDKNDALLQKYRVLGLPAVRFVSHRGTPLEAPRVDGFVPAAEFVQIMRRVP